MPTSTIHEIVGKKLTNKYKYLDNYNFYLGCIAPDSVNFLGFAPKEERWTAHLRSNNLSTWKNNIISFYKENKDKYNEVFLKGYITHIMTDIIYDELYYLKVTLPMKNIGKVDHDAHLYMLEEMKAYGNNNKDFNYVKDILSSKDTSFNIRNINKELMTDWKNKVIGEELPTIKVQFLTEEIIDSLTDKVEKELKKNEIL